MGNKSSVPKGVLGPEDDGGSVGGIHLLSIGPDVATAQELVAQALDFDNEEFRSSIEEAEIGVGHPPAWILKESLVLCSAAYEASFVSFAASHGSQITKIVESGIGYNEGKFYLCELIHEGQEFIFVIFRGYESHDTNKSELAFIPRIVDAGGLVSEPQTTNHHSIHPSFLIEAINQKKKAVITGHSLGGVQAHILTTRILRDLKAHNEKAQDNICCITFGTPIVSDDATVRSLSMFRRVFYHYALDSDIVTKAVCVASCVPTSYGGGGVRGSMIAAPTEEIGAIATNAAALTNAHPFGKVFIISRNEANHMVTMEMLRKSDYQTYYAVSWKMVNAREHVLQHSMRQYYQQLSGTSLLHQELSPAFLQASPASSITIAESTVRPFIRNCYLTGFEVEIEGEALSIIDQLFINDHPIKFSVYSSNSIIGRLDPQETLLATSNVINVTVTTIFRKSDGEKLEFPHLPLRLLGNSKVDMFPNELIASILPFTSLMLADPSLSTAPEHQESIAELLTTVDQELKKIESCIPVEFAFNMLTKDAHQQQRRNDAGEIDSHKHMKTFLKRLSEVEVMDWSKLCSSYMLRVLREAIEYLSEVLEENKEVEGALKDAFANHTLTNGWFEKLYVSTFDGFCESIYCANQSLSNRHFWDFIYKKQIKVGITFTVASQKAFEYIPFNEPYRLKTGEGIVLIEKENTEASNEDGVVVFTNRYKLTYPNNLNPDGEPEVQSFIHFEIFKGPNTPPTKLWISKITKTIGRVIITCKSEIRKSHFNSILVQSFDDFTLSTWFTYAWFLQYERDWPDVTRIEEINRILSEQIPLHKIDQFPKLDFKQVHDEILKRIESTYGFNIGLYFTKHPKRKVLVDLKLVREEMLNNHYSVSPPFFSGLAVDFEVKDSTKDFQVVPFFNFIPRAMSAMEENDKQSMTWEEVLAKSVQVTNGLEFMLLMLDRYVLLTRQELYQIRNSFSTRAANAALAAVQIVPTAIWGGFQMAKYLTDRRLSHVVNVEQRFRRMYDKIVFSDQQVASYKELLTNLIALLQLEIAPDASIETIEDVLYYSIPSAIGKYSLSELMIHAEEIFSEDIPIYQRWKELLNPRSKAVHLFIMKQIYHCHRLRMLRSKFITIAVNGQKNSGKSTLVQKVCGENYLPHIITGENPRESTIFPTGYRYPFDLPNNPPAMIIDLPGCTDGDTENIVSLFCDCVDVSIFMIYAREAANFNNSALKNFLMKFIHQRHGPSLICINGIDNNLKKYPKGDSTAGAGFAGSKMETFLLEVLEENRANWNNSKALNLPKMNPTASTTSTRQDGKSMTIPMWNVEGRAVITAAKEKGESFDYPLSHSVVFSSGKDGKDYPLSVWLTSLEGLDQYPGEFSSYIFGVEHIREWIREVREYYQGYRKKETFANLK